MSKRERLIRALATRYGLDPNAVVAIANVEGQAALHGGVSVGDHGTSFGPFQLHEGGALPAGKGSAWAHSRAGIDYALRQMAKVAGGLTGKAAVSAISSRFERPADVPGEIAKALSYYGKGGAMAPGVGGGQMGASVPEPPGAMAPPQDFRKQIGMALLQQVGQKNPDYSNVLDALRQQQDAQTQMPSPMPTPGRPTVPMRDEAPTGKPSLGFLSPLAKQFGLSVTSTTGGKHVPNSYHYRSRAEDYGGSPDKMSALMAYALAHPSEFTEAFYDPAGRYVKNGKVYKGSIGGHPDHVHLAR